MSPLTIFVITVEALDRLPLAAHSQRAENAYQVSKHYGPHENAATWTL